MQAGNLNLTVNHFRVLLRGESEALSTWTTRWDFQRMVFCILVIFLGAGLYGAAMGAWRDPRQSMFVAIKFPLILMLTTLGNALLNSTLAPLLGLNLTCRQSLFTILMSFAIAAAILGSFSPLIAFMVWNAPPMRPNLPITGASYFSVQLTHVGVIALAGTVAVFRLFQLLQKLSGEIRIASRVLIAWLAGNLFLGSQLCWIFRPFIGSPDLPVQFLRSNALQGSFYESVFHSLKFLLF